MILEDYIEKIKKIDFKEIKKPWLNKSIVNNEFFSDIYPDNKIEEWKNFNIKSIASKKLQVLENKNIFFKEDLNKNYKNLIPFKNGIFDESRLEKKLKKKINIFKANYFKKIIVIFIKRYMLILINILNKDCQGTQIKKP